jgi:hypothetical protein
MGFRMKLYVVDVYENTRDGIEGWNVEEVWATDAEDAWRRVHNWRTPFYANRVRLADRNKEEN